MNSVLRNGVALLIAAAMAGCGGGGGGGGDEVASSAPENRAPVAAILASGDVTAEGTAVSGTLGGTVHLDASGSSDLDKDALSYRWSLVTRPAGSVAPFPVLTQPVIDWQPDAMGDYTIALTVTDAKGASSSQQLVLKVNNHAPALVVVATPVFTTVPSTAPSQSVTVAGSVVLDASGTTDPDGDAVAVSFELLSKPTGSATVLTVIGKTARFSPDTLGSFKVRVYGVDTRGATFQSEHEFLADNRAPNPVVAATVSPVTLTSTPSSVVASVGYDVAFNGGNSSDPDGDAISRAWSLVSKPAGSTATLSSLSGTGSILSPDVLGSYVVTLTVTDAAGAKAVHTTTVLVNNRRPVATTSTNATPQALPVAPGTRLPLGTLVTLRGDASTDADGDTLSHAWSVATRPAGSVAQLSSGSAAAPTFTADREGSYVFKLRVTDSAGAYSEKLVPLDVGTHAPVAVVDRATLTVLTGSPTRASAVLSFDADGDALTYQWTLDAKPAGSAAQLGTVTSSGTSFVPDVAGTYGLTVTVRDARAASVARVTVQALAQMASSVKLDFVPDLVHYSTGLDKVVTLATNPNSLRIIDPFTGIARNVALPLSAKHMSLSADGRLATVLHDNTVTLVDLETAAIVRTSPTQRTYTESFVDNGGFIFLVGTYTSFADDAGSVQVLNGRTGAMVSWGGGSGYRSQAQYGVMADRVQKLFMVHRGFTPTDISSVSYDPVTRAVGTVLESPYHGDYLLDGQLYLTENQSLLFTTYGQYFRTDKLKYAGQLGGLKQGLILGFSHSDANQEALVLSTEERNVYPYGQTMPKAYKRYVGSALTADTDLPLPLIDGTQSIGVQIFHSASGRHVVLVQTGSEELRGEGAVFHLITR